MDISKLLQHDIEIKNLFDLSKTRAAFLFEGIKYPWEALASIGDAILKIGASLPEDEFDHPKEDVWIAKDAKVYPTAWIAGPCIIDHGTEVRHCAFIRGNALVGQNCVVGNSVELKNVILFDGVQTPHYNYVGDSILGYKAHMGAGSITSNVKSDRSPVAVKAGEIAIDSGRKKFGAMLGDQVEIGCNTVLNPGCVIGRASTVYPVSCVRGFVPAYAIYKAEGDVVFKVKTPPIIG
ncbi:MAG: UDP-N-acetylglucosamine pyrophosphorylase [Clostridia bacterium]|nr:UDP-N-acetylglucosamine pyrophosphorylase [Clostridia bacterium]